MIWFFHLFFFEPFPPVLLPPVALRWPDAIQRSAPAPRRASAPRGSRRTASGPALRGPRASQPWGSAIWWEGPLKNTGAIWQTTLRNLAKWLRELTIKYYINLFLGELITPEALVLHSVTIVLECFRLPTLRRKAFGARNAQEPW